jgi:peptide/nickel transport system permease protein
MVQGDFGTDVISGRPILDIILEVLPFTLALAFSSLALGLVLGIPLGVLAASRPGSLVDRGLGFVSIAFVTLPSFVVSIVLLLVFSLALNWLPVSGAGEPGDLGDQLLHLILPTVALALGWIGYVARIMRASLLEVLSEPHIRTMRAYGVSERRIIWRYAMRPALIPLVAILGIGLGDLISAAIFAEIIFSRPGLGNLIYKAASVRNYPIVQAGTVVVVLFCASLALLLSVDEVYESLQRVLAAAEPLIAGHPYLGAIVFVLLAALSAVLAFFSSALLVPPAVFTWGNTVTLVLLWLGWLLGGASGEQRLPPGSKLAIAQQLLTALRP